MPQDIATYLGIKDPKGRHKCPLCGSSDGLGVDPDQGDTGTVHCFACGFGEVEQGTGARLYAELEDVTIAEALQAFGVESSDLDRDVKRKEKRAPKPSVPERSDEEMKERCRAWKAMVPAEIEMLDAYEKKRAAAQANRDREEFDRWQEKIDLLYEFALEREMAAHRDVDRLDTLTT